MELPHTEKRVIEHSPEEINACLRREMESRLLYYAGNPDLINDRLDELDQEWDMERMLETNAAGISLFGILMASRNHKWMILPFVVAGFLLQHALQGWCPPVELFRRIGVRTMNEINTERYALKTLRGDYDDLNLSQVADPFEKARLALETAERNT